MRSFEITPNAQHLLQTRYFAEGETEWGDVTNRVASAVANAEPEDQREHWKYRFEEMMDDGLFLPNTPTLVNAGLSGPRCLSACFADSPNDDLDSCLLYTSPSPRD